VKEIKAYIKPHKLPQVTLALHQIEGLTGMSVLNVRGFGRGRARQAADRITDGSVDFIPQVKIEVVCRDELAEKVVSTIEKAACTGLRGDGKIYVSDVEMAVRISTGERGTSAV
jgi:nitrogen regulatory protein P-II 1